jgi:hypothetical protein
MNLPPFSVAQITIVKIIPGLVGLFLIYERPKRNGPSAGAESLRPNDWVLMFTIAQTARLTFR